MSTEEQRGFSTRALHTPIPYLYPKTHIMPPFSTSTYCMESLDPPNDQEFFFKYPRIAHPNGELLEHTLASLEGGQAAAVTADGMRAISTTLMAMLPWNENTQGTIVSTAPLYSHTYSLLTRYLAPLGKQCVFLHASPHYCDDFQKIIKDSEWQLYRAPVEILFIETPANPTLTIWDIKALAEIAHAHDILVIVDGTFATPYNQRPLELGADLVIHSLTKYICGNGTTLGGAVIGSYDHIKTIKERLQIEGGHLNPYAAWLIQIGLQTFGVRMSEHNKNAMALARFLNKKEYRNKIARVYYPGLTSNTGHLIAKEQMRTPEGKQGFGGMVSFELARPELVKPFASALAESFIALAVSLGCTSSLFSVPALQIHGALPADERKALGISDTLIRFSVGIEDIRDIKNALVTALSRLP